MSDLNNYIPKDSLQHYGTKRHSGRYPWGSGENPYQRDNRGFIERVHQLKDEGQTEQQIAEALGIKKKDGTGDTAALRARIAIANHEIKKEQIARITKLRYEKQMSIREIAKQENIPASTVRSLLDPERQARNDQLINTADKLKEVVAEKGYIDVGKGANYALDVTEDKLKKSLYILKEEGYEVYTVKVEQVGTGHYTEMKVLCPPGTKYGDLVKNKDKIKSIDNYIIKEPDGTTKLGMLPPKSVDSSRIQIRYAEDGGKDKDGVIELRRGVDDISLGKAQYAQVRIAVDDTHYLKGMAMYSDDLPDGVDIIFNTNKSKDVPMMSDDKNNTVLKKMKDDKDNPFGATIKQEGDSDNSLKMCQQYYIDENGVKQQSCINVVNEQGDWGTWSKTLASQFLSKQPTALAEKQLNLTVANKKYEYEEIKALTQPEVKEKLLIDFANSCDSDAVHLKAAALPRQSSKVILPSTDLKENEIYAPTYRDGETVILIRYPHGGTFEIPELKVNNTKNTDAKRLLGPSATDAVAINSKVAERLSGADFDGDTVLVIPVRNAKGEKTVGVTTSDPLPGLKNFDPKEQYKAYPGMPRLSHEGTQQEMGKISNLITDMTLKGASREEIERAVKHSMVVIDAEKHYLNYKQSYIDNNIAELKEKYQGGKNRGASTIISKAKSVEYINERKDYYHLDEKGHPIYEDKPNNTYTKTWTTKKGEVREKEVQRKQKSTKMFEADDARSLVSTPGTRMEYLYADYANEMKALGDKARLEASRIKHTSYNESVAKAYKKEVDSLNVKLERAEKNAPRERQAQIIANSIVSAKKDERPELREDKDALKKVKNQALAYARDTVNAHKQDVLIDITDKEWEAIQAGAIKKTKLKRILENCDSDRIRELATPKTQTKGLTTAQRNRILAYQRAGWTIQDIADEMGISKSTVSNIISS